MDNKIFIEKSNQVHSYKYNYSKTIYVNSKSKVIIICPTHGEFEQTPKVHLRGGGCQKCALCLIKTKSSSNTKEFIEKAQKVHGNKYDYSKVEYKRSNQKVKIICPIHGEFKQMATVHLRNHGCPRCSIEKLTNNTKEFIEKAQKVHGNKYDYSKVEYKRSNQKVKIICPIHGEFGQIARSHLSGVGCSKCVGNYKPNTKEFIEKAQKVHGNKYDYSKVEYKGSNQKVIIICPIHGEFRQIAFTHIAGSNCPKCVGRHKPNTKEFIEKAQKVHGNKYDYSKVEYKGANQKITIICPTHGEFEQKATSHLSGSGCSQCLDFTVEDFIKKATTIHHKYDYSKVIYTNTCTNVTIVCPKHGEFEQTPSNHLQGHGCPRCVNAISSGHSEIIDFIKSITNNKILVNDRTIIHPYELDIFMPSMKIAIEYHGIYWHSYNRPESCEEKNKHIVKHQLCQNLGIRLIQVYENEWSDRGDILKSKFNVLMGNADRIYARDCTIEELDNKTYRKFVEQYHLQGYKTSSIKFGLMYRNELVSVMSFNRHPKYEWEITRFANKLNTVIVGGAGKLYKHFRRKFGPNAIMTYADRRYSDGNLYRKLGFKLDGFTKPNYFYVRNGQIYCRQQFQKHRLQTKLEFFDPNLTEAENMFRNGFRRIWDAGHYRFIN